MKALVRWLVRVERHPLGPRVRLFGGLLRVHHYTVGFALIAQGARMVWRDLPDLLDFLLLR